MKVIGFTGQAQAGKSLSAQLLVDHYGKDKAIRLHIADPIKIMLKTLGLSEDQLNGHLKEQKTDLLLGKSPRYAMQTLGTEWGRDLIGEEIWVEAWARLAQREIDQGKIVLMESVRFKNEADKIIALGGIIFNIKRPMSQATGNTESQHVSEFFTHPGGFDIANSGTIEDLKTNLINTINYINRQFSHPLC